MDKQVGKSAIFTKESLRNIQDKMREYCIISFNNIYETNYTIKMKEEGRNFDYDITDMRMVEGNIWEKNWMIVLKGTDFFPCHYFLKNILLMVLKDIQELVLWRLTLELERLWLLQP